VLKRLLATVAKELDKAGISYMITGGQAVLAHGEVRVTKDIDVTIGVGSEGLAEVEKAAKKMKLAALTENSREFVGKTLVLPLIHPSSGIRVDFIFSDTEFERRAIKRAVKITIGNYSVSVISLEDLIVEKIFAGRPRDLDDAANLMRIHPNLGKKRVISELQKFDKMLDTDFSGMFGKLVKKTPLRRPE
jgi:predicted nucleotidyltransferase